MLDDTKGDLLEGPNSFLEYKASILYGFFRGKEREREQPLTCIDTHSTQFLPHMVIPAILSPTRESQQFAMRGASASSRWTHIFHKFYCQPDYFQADNTKQNHPCAEGFSSSLTMKKKKKSQGTEPLLQGKFWGCVWCRAGGRRKAVVMVCRAALMLHCMHWELPREGASSCTFVFFRWFYLCIYLFCIYLLCIYLFSGCWRISAVTSSWFRKQVLLLGHRLACCAEPPVLCTGPTTMQSWTLGELSCDDCNSLRFSSRVCTQFLNFQQRNKLQVPASLRTCCLAVCWLQRSRLHLSTAKPASAQIFHHLFWNKLELAEWVHFRSRYLAVFGWGVFAPALGYPKAA